MQRELTKEELKILDTEHNQEHYAKMKKKNLFLQFKVELLPVVYKLMQILHYEEPAH